MSWVFLVDDKVYKLKKPVRFPYLDFSTLAKREAACRAELRLNRRLAPDVYLDTAPLRISAHGFSIGGDKGLVVDWLVVMRRLDERAMLDHAIAAGQIARWQLDQLADALVHFYRRAVPALVTAEQHLVHWCQSLSDNRRVLLDARLRQPAGLVRRVHQTLRRFLAQRSRVLTARVRERHLVDGHGDLRPEHVWLGNSVRIIDCLEFNDRLRMVDPFDEIAFLDLECERLGVAWIGRYIGRKVARGLSAGMPKDLYLFYRCHRATLRARLAITHLLEPDPRTPEKWPILARS
jgi:aminoglycoside phosphotransferase family enzyme